MNTARMILGACLLALPLSVSAGEFLSGEQITATFAGKTTAWQHMKKSDSGRSYTAADGTIVKKEPGGSTATSSVSAGASALP